MGPTTYRIVTGGTLALALTTGISRADPVADFYKDKQITVVVGYGPGGGYDAYARLLLRHMPRHVPGNPAMVIQHLPGAGSLRAANFVFNAAPKDGSSLGVFGAPAALEPLFGNKDAKFDTLKFNWIGNMLRDTASCGTWYNSGLTSLQQLLDSKTEFVFGASGAGSYANQNSMVLKDMLGAKLRVITGFKGIKDVALALERGELHGACALSVSTVKTTFDQNAQAGQLKFLVQFGKEDLPFFRGAPNFYKMIKSEDQRIIADLFFGQMEIARPLIAPPGTPPQIVAALRKAFEATVKDPALLGEAARANLDVDFVSGEDTAKAFADFYKTPPELIQKARAIMGRN